MTVIRLLCVTVVVLSVGPVQAQQHATVEAQEHATLRAMLTRAGFGDDATGASAPDLERALTSSKFGTSADSFVGPSAVRWLPRWPPIKPAAINVRSSCSTSPANATLEPPPPHMHQLFAASRGNQEATNRFFSAITGSSPLPAFMNPDNIRRLVAQATA